MSYKHHFHFLMSPKEKELFESLQIKIANEQGLIEKPPRFGSQSLRFMLSLTEAYFEGRL